MMAAKIGQRRAVDHRPRARAELPLENGVGIGAGHRMHRVKTHFEAGGEQSADRVEVEQRLHQRRIFGDGVDDGDLGALDPGHADRIEIDDGRIGDSVMVDRLGVHKHRVGDFLRRGSAVADIVFDAEVAVRAAGIVACRQDDPAIGGASANEAGHRRRREDAALADNDMAKAVGGGDLDDLLDRFAVVIAPVAADDQNLASETLQRVENRLHEVLDIVRLLEDRHLLAQAGGARLLVGIRRGFDGADHLERSLPAWRARAGRRRSAQSSLAAPAGAMALRRRFMAIARATVPFRYWRRR